MKIGAFTKNGVLKKKMGRVSQRGVSDVLIIVQKKRFGIALLWVFEFFLQLSQKCWRLLPSALMLRVLKIGPLAKGKYYPKVFINFPYFWYYNFI